MRVSNGAGLLSAREDFSEEAVQGPDSKDKWNHPARIGEGDLGRREREQAGVGGVSVPGAI